MFSGVRERHKCWPELRTIRMEWTGEGKTAEEVRRTWTGLAEKLGQAESMSGWES